MPVVGSLEELVGLLGRVAASPDPISSLEQQGFTLAPEVRQALDRGRPARRLSAERRERLARVVQRMGHVRFNIRPITPLPARALPEGEADFIASFKVAILNETLAGLFSGMEWPKRLDRSQISGLFEIDRLREFSDDIPPGGLTRVGALNLTAPASVELVDGTDHVIFTLPFSLDIERRLPAPVDDAAVVVASLNGSLRFGIVVSADVTGDVLELLPDSAIADPSEQERLRLTVDPESPVQPRSPQTLADLERDLDAPLAGLVFLALKVANLSISPVIHLPLGKDTTVRVVHAQARCVVAGDGPVVRIGVLLEGSPEVAISDAVIGASPPGFAESNVHARVHEDLFRKVLKAALASGELQKIVTEASGDEDIRVDDVDVSLRPNLLRLVFDGRAVDACPTPGPNFLDIGFRATINCRISLSTDARQITVTFEEPDVDRDNTDVLACGILLGFELLVAFLIHTLTLSIFRIVRTFGGSDSIAPLVVTSVFDPRRPLPGTEDLPRVEAHQVSVENTLLQSSGLLTLRQDDVNTYIYAAFVRRNFADLKQPLRPIDDAGVDLFDQDVPVALPGEAPPPPDTFEEIFRSERRVVTLSTTFQPPRRDEQLARGRTDAKGRVRFVLTPEEVLTTSGAVVTVRTVEHLDTMTEDITRTVTPRTETRPDLYFRVRPTDGDPIDTRLLARGLVINSSVKHVGRAEAPLTFLIEEGPVVDLG